MPYRTNRDLPQSVRAHLPKHAQDLYRQAFNHALDEYDGHEEAAHRVAWAAVKRKYLRAADGSWTPRNGAGARPALR